jgi:hypothetical protein
MLESVDLRVDIMAHGVSHVGHKDSLCVSLYVRAALGVWCDVLCPYSNKRHKRSNMNREFYNSLK